MLHPSLSSWKVLFAGIICTSRHGPLSWERSYCEEDNSNNARAVAIFKGGIVVGQIGLLLEIADEETYILTASLDNGRRPRVHYTKATWPRELCHRQFYVYISLFFANQKFANSRKTCNSQLLDSRN